MQYARGIIMEKTNCFNYFEWQDMGACVPCCSLRSNPGDCPCDKCDKFLSKTDARKIINNYYEKHGNWLKSKVRQDETLVCSVCGKDSGTIYKYDYCPNCGAAMDK
jgi:hypothetical protein